jgi:hypothetical protein
MGATGAAKLKRKNKIKIRFILNYFGYIPFGLGTHKARGQ